MAINSVFVYADGQIGLVTLPVETEPSNWRRVKRSVVTVSVSEAPAHLTTEEFDRRGRMFDGRPIYCADGFDVKEAYQVGLFTAHEIALGGPFDALRSAIRQFIRDEYPDAIDLDTWEGDVPLTPDEIADGLALLMIVKKGIRRLVVVRSPPEADVMARR